jgi:hypothetical protein
VLQDCSGLTALDLRYCVLQDVPATAAAIAALPELRCLKLADLCSDDQDRLLLAELDFPSQLTHLSLGAQSQSAAAAAANLSQLSRLVDLQHLRVKWLPDDGIPGGLLSQLAKLTCLDLTYQGDCDAADQLQHLSSLPALQELSLRWDHQVAEIVSAILHLSQLTCLKLDLLFLDFETFSTSSWTSLTALQRLELARGQLQPEAFLKVLAAAGLSTQLR